MVQRGSLASGAIIAQFRNKSKDRDDVLPVAQPDLANRGVMLIPLGGEGF